MSRSKKAKDTGDASAAEPESAVERGEQPVAEPSLDNALVLVEKLQEFGINAPDIQKLKQSGIFTVAGVMMQTKKTLLNIKGFSDAKVDKLLESCAKISVRCPPCSTQEFLDDVPGRVIRHPSLTRSKTGTFITGSECLTRRKNLIKISTGSTALDQLLGTSILVTSF